MSVLCTKNLNNFWTLLIESNSLSNHQMENVTTYHTHTILVTGSSAISSSTNVSLESSFSMHMRILPQRRDSEIK